MNSKFFAPVALLAAALSTGAAVQTQPQQQQIGPPMRTLGPALATTTEQILQVSQVRGLPGGRVLVNDGLRRRLAVFDSNMVMIKVVADSAVGFTNAYGTRAGKLLPYFGDSSLLVDAASYSMLVIDGDGQIAKVKAIPRAEHATYISSVSTTYGNPGIDAKGRLVFRGPTVYPMMSVAAGGGIYMPEPPDSVGVLGVDLVTRKVDTVGRVRVPKSYTTVVQSTGGGVSMRDQMNPMPVNDDWSVVSDGSIAFLRHRDYHVDWLNPDGTYTSSPPMPFDWQRITDDNKKAFLDSVSNMMETSRRRSITRYDSINFACFELRPPDRNWAPLTGPGSAPLVPPAPPGGAAPPPAGRDGPMTVTTVTGGVAGGAVRTTAVTRLGGAGDAGRAAGAGDAGRAAVAAGGRGAAPPPAPAGSQVLIGPGGEVITVPRPACPVAPYQTEMMFGSMTELVPANALPDYKPPFGTGALRADADNNLWVRVNQMKPVPGTYHFDIVNRKGELFDRLQIPVARSVVGFGEGGIVYVTSRGPEGLKLERVRWSK